MADLAQGRLCYHPILFPGPFFGSVFGPVALFAHVFIHDDVFQIPFGGQ